MLSEKKEKKMCNYKGVGKAVLLACCLKKSQGSTMSHTAWQHSLLLQKLEED
jgi:hypothetical protein